MIFIGILGSIFYAVAIITFFILITPVAVLTWLLTTPFDKYRYINHGINCFIGRMIIFLNPFWRVKVHNMDKVNFKDTYLLASNHQSLVDIPILTLLFPLDFKYISKKELTYVPFIGWIMAMAKDVLVSRKDPKSQIKMMKTCEAHLKRGCSIAIFPEGTRSRDGELGDFKDGAALLAKVTNTKILPICMADNFGAMPHKGVFWKKVVTFNAYILDPIDPKDFKKTKDLSLALKESINNQLQILK
jgi:1-acyl-sn-glycerol-3-phosphate acyltransferase